MSNQSMGVRDALKVFLQALVLFIFVAVLFTVFGVSGINLDLGPNQGLFIMVLLVAAVFFLAFLFDAATIHLSSQVLHFRKQNIKTACLISFICCVISMGTPLLSIFLLPNVSIIVILFISLITAVILYVPLIRREYEESSDNAVKSLKIVFLANTGGIVTLILLYLLASEANKKKDFDAFKAADEFQKKHDLFRYNY